MARTTPIFRLFVSSTFADLKAERSALQGSVFPRLRALCARRGASFQPIDLRWGVSAEAGLEQLTMKICLAEVERCQKTTTRPNFMILLGDRYGWRPLPAEVPAAELEALLALVDEPSDAELVRASYVRDENQVPPTYLLRPRYRRGRELADAEWQAVEARLQAVLVRAAERAQFPVFQAAKYCASATEQEIQAGLFNVPAAHEHVLCFQRDTAGLPADDSAGEFIDLAPNGMPDDYAQRRFADLKVRLRARLGPRLRRYPAEWTGEGVSTEHIARLCEDIYEALGDMILKELDHGVHTGGDEEAAALEFARERTRFFVGRGEPLATIKAHLGSKESAPLAIVGNSGSGKSTLLARAALLRDEAEPEAEVIMRFIGVTAGSADVRFLLEDLCGTIAHRYGSPVLVGGSFEELVRALPERFALASAERPLYIFIDAVDQLTDANNARALAWLPDHLPDHVQLVLSTTEGECLEALRDKLDRGQFMTLDVMPAVEGADLLDQWLAAEHRRVTVAQQRLILDAFAACPYPLYLRLAYEEARRWRSFDKVVPPKPTIRGVISDLFARLSRDTEHGPLLTSRALGYLAASRFGLSEEELLGALSLDDEFCRDFFARSPYGLPKAQGGGHEIPVVLWSRLFFDLQPYLSERDQDAARLVTFYHKQLADVAGAAYLCEAPRDGAGDEGGTATAGAAVSAALQLRLSAAGRARHAVLAAFFRAKADPLGDHSWSGDSLRGLSELPFHLTEAADWDELIATLTDFAFLENKVTNVGVVERVGPDGERRQLHAGVYQLLDDYRLALDVLPGSEEIGAETGTDGGGVN